VNWAPGKQPLHIRKDVVSNCSFTETFALKWRHCDATQIWLLEMLVLVAVPNVSVSIKWCITDITVHLEWGTSWFLGVGYNSQQTLMTDLTIWQPGFDLPCCAANLHKASSDKCRCGMVQTIWHVVNGCANTMLPDGVLQRLHSADSDAVNWLERTVMTAVAKWIN